MTLAHTTLAIAPKSQAVPFDTPTIFHTVLQGYATAQGPLPADFRVVSDITGPEIDVVLELATVPNEPFRNRACRSKVSTGSTTSALSGRSLPSCTWPSSTRWR